MASAFVSPPVWSDEQIEADRREAQRRFIETRREEGPRAFAATCARVRPDVEAAMAASKDLLDLTGQVFLDDPLAWQVFRYVCGPPISQEDLWTLVEGPKFTKGVPPAYAEATATALRDVIDTVRFPWVAGQRAPTVGEREAAVLSTTVLLAAQLLGTSRRRDASRRQEDATAAAFAAAGFELDSSRAPMYALDGLARGTYSRERVIAGAKCDVPARLNDGRLLMLECKVSNGPKNGWKRVNREVAGKADTWGQHFGKQVLTGVVLAGSFDAACLRTAQERGVLLLWEHDLRPLADFVADTA